MFLLQLIAAFIILHFVYGVTVYENEPIESLEHTHKKPIPILKQDFKIHHEGYQYGFEAANGIHVQETGYIKNKGDKKHETLVQHGQITYHDEHGKPITLTYVADENGFQPQGAHLPTPPPHSNGISSEESNENHAEEYDGHEALNAEQYPHLLYQLVH